MESMSLLLGKLKNIAAQSNQSLKIEMKDERLGVYISIGESLFITDSLNSRTLLDAVVHMSSLARGSDEET